MKLHIESHKLNQIQEYLLVFIAFSIPIWPRINAIFIGLFSLLGLIRFVSYKTKERPNAISITFWSFYALHLIGIFYTDNIPRGLFDLEVKLSFLVLPIGFLASKSISKATIVKVLNGFLLGTMISAIFCLGQSFYNVVILEVPYYQALTSRFSVIIHPSYFSMYLGFSLVILAYLRWPIVSKVKPIWSLLNGVVILILFVSIVLSGSKIGLIIWLFTLVIILVRYIVIQKSIIVPIVSACLMLGIFAVILETAPVLQARVLNMVKVVSSDSVKASSKESTAVRTLVYTSAFEIIKEQDWYGQGTGDFQDRLDLEYDNRGYSQAGKVHLNAHNLFLQSWISLGVFGLLNILFIFALLLYQSINSKHFIFLIFSIQFFLISLTESSLNVQAGVIFFVFFTVLFSKANPQDSKEQ